MSTEIDIGRSVSHAFVVSGVNSALNLGQVLVLGVVSVHLHTNCRSNCSVGLFYEIGLRMVLRVVPNALTIVRFDKITARPADELFPVVRYDELRNPINEEHSLFQEFDHQPRRSSLYRKEQVVFGEPISYREKVLVTRSCSGKRSHKVQGYDLPREPDYFLSFHASEWCYVRHLVRRPLLT
jgi:hypothetical protein